MDNKLTVGELVYKISGDMDNLKTELKKTEAKVSELEKSMSKTTKTTASMSKGFKLAAIAFSTFIGSRFVQGIVSLAKTGAEVESLRNSFNNLSNSIGLDSEEVLKNLRKLSGGTISDKDLILSSNRAMVLGVAKNMDEFSTLMQTARLRARDMGLTTTQAFDNIVTGIGRGSPLILDNLGFVISATQAQENYAKKLGITADQLTETQKKESVKASILKQGNEEIEKAGKITNNYSDRLAQASTMVENLKERIGQALLPAMASLLSTTLDTNKELLGSNDQINKLGKIFYQVAQGILSVSRVIGIALRGIFVAAQGAILFTAESIQNVLKVVQKFAKVFKIDSGLINGAVETTGAFIEDLKGRIEKSSEGIVDSSKKLGTSLSESLDPKNYQGVGDDVIKLLKGIKGGGEEAADGTNALTEAQKKAKEELQGFQGTMIGFINDSKKVSATLNEDLAKSFTTFGDSIKANAQETVAGLGAIVIGAQDKIKDLKEQLSNSEDQDTTERLRKEISTQQEILDSRVGFEKRQSDRIQAIRDKLTEAGIDATKAGLDSVLTVKSLEDEIADERARAELNEFTRFEQDQAKKLAILTDNLITEITLTKEKIDKQSEYEATLTDYLLQQEKKRLSNTDKWATDTINKYKGVADQLQSLLSLQSQFGAVKSPLVGGAPTIPSNNQLSPQVSNNTTNSTNVNAPVTINGDAFKNLSPSELSAILGRELNKRIKQ